VTHHQTGAIETKGDWRSFATPLGSKGAPIADRLLSVLVSALSQTWEPFVLILGLLLIGHSASKDGLFETIGARLAALPGGGLTLFVSMMGLVAVVTATLNLDTSVVFLTPILLHTTRRRGIDERAFLYGSIFMANSASLLLLGSNLTNILVFAGRHVRGAAFSRAMLPAWAVSIVLTTLVVVVWCWRDLRREPVATPNETPRVRSWLGFVGLGVATVLMLVMPNPALPVLVVGVTVEVCEQIIARTSDLGTVLGVLNLSLLVGLFSLALLVAVIAREWHYPERLMASSGVWESAGIGAGGANLINNLPAAALLSSKLPHHPYALLFGLDLGPNLAVLGAMSSMLWLRVARHNGARPSALTFSRVGVFVTATTLAASLLVS
jgi:arsenical pump membrane protein